MRQLCEMPAPKSSFTSDPTEPARVRGGRHVSRRGRRRASVYSPWLWVGLRIGGRSGPQCFADAQRHRCIPHQRNRHLRNRMQRWTVRSIRRPEPLSGGRPSQARLNHRCEYKSLRSHLCDRIPPTSIASPCRSTNRPYRCSSEASRETTIGAHVARSSRSCQTRTGPIGAMCCSTVASRRNSDCFRSTRPVVPRFPSVTLWACVRGACKSAVKRSILRLRSLTGTTKCARRPSPIARPSETGR